MKKMEPVKTYTQERRTRGHLSDGCQFRETSNTAWRETKDLQTYGRAGIPPKTAAKDRHRWTEGVTDLHAFWRRQI